MANYGLNNQTNYVNKLTLRAFSRNFRELFELLPCLFSRKCFICMQRQSIPVNPPPSHQQTGCDGVWNACGCDRQTQTANLARLDSTHDHACLRTALLIGLTGANSHCNWPYVSPSQSHAHKMRLLPPPPQPTILIILILALIISREFTVIVEPISANRQNHF